MPRTFSLARLLLAVTLIAALCGLAVNFPVFGQTGAPAIIVLVSFVCFSNEPIVMALFCFVGASAGAMVLKPMALAVLGEPSAPALQQNQLAGAITTAVCPAFGAFLVGAALVFIEFYYPPPVLRNDTPGQQPESNH